ncbi:hypothetical protein BJY00DRAFT_312746 [Aspergillus carlsbadensis]|nr:hypothetical protein BJY00DRAFT_312746 [Aspergillus carlsbadensis]
MNAPNYKTTVTVPFLPRVECAPPANSNPNVPAPNCAGDPSRYHLFVLSPYKGSGAFASEWRGLNCHGAGTSRACDVTPDWRRKTNVEGHFTNPAFPGRLTGVEVFGDTCSYTADINVTKGTRSVGTLPCNKWKDAICIKGPDSVSACGQRKYAAYMLICEWPGDYYQHMGDRIAPFP